MIYFLQNDPELHTKLAPIKVLLESETVEKIGQNIKYDMLVLRKYDIVVAGPLFDTMLADYVVDPDHKHNMDKMALDYLNYQAVSITTLIGKKGKNQLSMRDVPKDKLLDYACEDSDITLSLKEKLAPMVTEREVEEVFRKVEMPLVPVLTEMENTGVKIDVDQLKIQSEDLKERMDLLEARIYDLAGMRFNINSPTQMAEILFDRLKLPTGKKTGTGKFSTREEELVRLSELHEMPESILQFRQLGKLKSTYVDALPLLIDPDTGRIHTTYSQAIAATGRLSSNNPNLQNIPIRTEEGRKVRKAFIPGEEGWVLLAADYSQVELRLAAHFSEDPGLTEAFLNKEDIHRATASKVFHVSMDEVTPAMRSKAKEVNFGLIYGMSAFGLAQRLRISRTEASEIIKEYFAQFPNMKGYMDDSIQLARDAGFATTIMGRKRYLRDINSQNATLRGMAERNAINTPLQGSAADLIKVAMIDLHAALKKTTLKARMLMQVHDELVFEVPKNEIEELTALVKDKMENAIPFKVPMIVEAGIGADWLEAH